MTTEAGLELESRRRIFDYIASHPGVHLRKMERDLSLSTGMLSYHLDVLERRGVLRSEVQENRRCYFPAKAFRQDQRRALALLRQRVPRRILLELLLNGPRTFAELQAQAGVSPSTLSYHLKKLSVASLVLRGRRERESVLEVKDRELVADLLVTAGASLEDDAVERFVDLWSKLRR